MSGEPTASPSIELTAIFGAKIEQVVDGVHHFLLLPLQGGAVPRGLAQLDFQLLDHPALPPDENLETSFLLLQSLQFVVVPHLHR